MEIEAGVKAPKGEGTGVEVGALINIRRGDVKVGVAVEIEAEVERNKDMIGVVVEAASEMKN